MGNSLVAVSTYAYGTGDRLRLNRLYATKSDSECRSDQMREKERERDRRTVRYGYGSAPAAVNVPPGPAGTGSLPYQPSGTERADLPGCRSRRAAQKPEGEFAYPS